MCENDRLSYIIQSRIRDYKHDLECVKGAGTDESSRITQDKVIIQELEKILTGKDLGVLSYVS